MEVQEYVETVVSELILAQALSTTMVYVGLIESGTLALDEGISLLRQNATALVEERGSYGRMMGRRMLEHAKSMEEGGFPRLRLIDGGKLN